MAQPVRPARTKDKTATTGTGSYTVIGTAFPTYQTFADALLTGDEIEYYVEEDNGTDWEVVRGVWTEAGGTLTRGDVLESSNSGSAVDWAVGNKTMGIVVASSLEGMGDYKVKQGGAAVQVDLPVAAWKGVRTYAYGRRAVTGDSQVHKVPISMVTTNATPAEFQIGAVNFATNEDLDLLDDRLYVFDGLIGAWQYSGATVGDCGAYRIEGAIKVVSGTCALVGTPTITVIGEDDAAWTVAITADDTNDRLSIKVTGAASHSIHWHGHLNMVEVG